MSYLVLARKTRPQQFADVVAQQHVVQAIQNAISLQRLPHALLLCGSRGIGKTSIARLIAKTINCLQPQTDPLEPCDTCENCSEIRDGRAVDVIEIDGASNRSIDDIRELRDGVKYLPTKGKRKAYIIDEVHMLTREAFNALLKTLEEPPEHVIFMLATTEPHKIPITILSRCQRFDFKRPSLSILSSHIAKIAANEGLELSEESVGIIARAAKGGLRDSMSLLDQVVAFSGARPSDKDVAQAIGAVGQHFLFKIGRAVFEKDIQTLLSSVDELFLYAYDLRLFTQELCAFFRDLLVVKLCPDPYQVCELTPSEMEEIQKIATLANETLIQQMFSILSSSSEEIARSNSPRLLLEMVLMRMAKLEPVRPFEDILQQLSSLEGRLLESGGAGAVGQSTPEAPTLSLPEKKNLEQVKLPHQSEESVQKQTSEKVPSFPPRLPTLELTSQDFIKEWDRILDKMEKEHGFLAHRVAGARFALREGNVLELGLTAELERKMLDSKEKVAILEAFLKKEGFPLQVRISVIQNNAHEYCMSVRERRLAKQQAAKQDLQKIALEHPFVQKLMKRIPNAKITEIHPLSSPQEEGKS